MSEEQFDTPEKTAKAEDYPLIKSEIWECTNEHCNVWMRKDMTLDEEPICPICMEKMKSGVRLAPELKQRIKPRFQKTFKFRH